MTKTTNQSASAPESKLELKYCERCGGLWLRPSGGGQIYCVVCARAMGDLPPAAYTRETGRNPQLPQGPREDGEASARKACQKYSDFDLDAAGGAA